MLFRSTTKAKDLSEDLEGLEESNDEDTPKDDPLVRLLLYTSITKVVLKITISSNNSKGKATRAPLLTGSIRSTSN